MHICCESCGTHYRIPIEKMKGDVSKATCKKCGTTIMIRRGAQAEASRMDDEGVVTHNEDRTVITQVPELSDYQVTPVLDSSAFSTNGIAVKMGKGATPAENAISTRLATAARLENEIFGRPGKDSEAVVTVEAEDTPPVEGPPPRRASAEPLLKGTSKKSRQVPLPAGARKVAEMPKTAAELNNEKPLIPSVAKNTSASTMSDAIAKAVDKSSGGTAEVEVSFNGGASKAASNGMGANGFGGNSSATGSISAASLLAATAKGSSNGESRSTGAQNTSSGMSPELARLMMPDKSKSMGNAAAATSMHRDLAAQYDMMVKGNLPPGFASEPVSASKRPTSIAKPTTSEKRSAPMGAARVTGSAPVVTATPVMAAPPVNNRVARIVAGALSVMAFASVMLLVVKN